MSKSSQDGEPTSTGSSQCHQTHAERALKRIIPLAAKFQDRFGKAMENRETGFCLIRVEYDRGRVTQLYFDNRELHRPDEDERNES